MPAGYGTPRDGSGAALLPWSRAVEQLEGARNYWICTTRADGRPHTAPVWGLWLDGAVRFSTGGDTAKARNIARDPRIVVHLESGDETVILEGTVETTRADERFLDAYEAKYDLRPEADTTVYVLRPRVAQTWTEKGFTRDATRWEFD
jgi:PPOX class probable F420-dependent enzyme